jgi:hypothetical protein
MFLPERAKTILASKGRELKGIGLNEFALSKLDAIDVVRSLEGSQMSVLGGDVYAENDGKLRPTCESWFCNQQPGENPFGFVQRSRQTALNFLQSQPDTSHKFYVLVLAGLGVVGPKNDQ